ncbi:MAG: DNA repair protein RecO [Bacteroidaceae bacterium]|nr:DNA repair protein RecO [Bacteroidaceae bacterium]
MVEKFDGIVLRTLKYSDSLLIVDVYTRQRGRYSFLSPISHSKRGRVRSVLFQPLSMLSFTASCRQGKRLPRISDVQPYAMYSSIPFNVVKSSIAMFLSEVLTYSLREEEGDESLFIFLDRSFILFDNLENGYADFHIIFMAQLLRYLGIFPNIENFSAGDYLDLVQGCVSKEHPLHPSFLMPQEAAAFVSILRTGYEAMHTLSLNRELRGCYLAILIDYYRLHIPDFPQLKSFEVLKELFN